jgi:dsDNA-specific endonuclease/ATPase MutS2
MLSVDIEGESHRKKETMTSEAEEQELDVEKEIERLNTLIASITAQADTEAQNLIDEMNAAAEELTRPTPKKRYRKKTQIEKDITTIRNRALVRRITSAERLAHVYEYMQLRDAFALTRENLEVLRKQRDDYWFVEPKDKDAGNALSRKAFLIQDVLDARDGIYTGPAA